MGVLPCLFYGGVGCSVGNSPQHTTVLWKRFLPRTSPPTIAFPLGGRWPGEAGSDEGATRYPTPQKNQRCPIAALARRGLFYRSVGYAIAPSSVTCGDSFPPGGSRRTRLVVHRPASLSAGERKPPRETEPLPRQNKKKTAGQGPTPLHDRRLLWGFSAWETHAKKAGGTQKNSPLVFLREVPRRLPAAAAPRRKAGRPG